MRLLEQKRISYTPHEYAHGDGAVDGVTVAKLTDIAPERIFKTLVTRGVSKGIYVFAVPVAAELDLKKAAKAVGEKSITMLHVSEINAATGYIRGGCSPIGMKKLYPTTYHESINELPGVCVSAGRIGYQIELAPADLIKLTRGKTADIITEDQIDNAE